MAVPGEQRTRSLNAVEEVKEENLGSVPSVVVCLKRIIDSVVIQSDVFGVSQHFGKLFERIII
jgi:hypothetical protein